MIYKEETKKTDKQKLSGSTHVPLKKVDKKFMICGVNADSPTIPPRIVTALNPIWMTVKNLPGCACRSKTFCALTLPSLARGCKRIFLDAAKEISANAKKKLAEINRIIMMMLPRVPI